MNQTILIDGDVLVYKTAFSVETPVYVVGGGVYSRKPYAEAAAKAKGLQVKKRVNIGSEKELRTKLDRSLKQMFDDCSTHTYKLYLTAENVNNNYRSQIATYLPYKGNRAQSVKPIHYRRLREILVKEYNAEIIIGQEADDQLGIEQINFRRKLGNYEGSIIATIDKDLKTVPGHHYHFTNRTISFVNEQEALKNFYKQILTGDQTDNIPGLVKLLKLSNREEEANKLSYGHYIKNYEEWSVDKTPQECYSKIEELYKQHGFGKKELSEIGNLLWIRREEEQIWSNINESL